MWIHRRNRLLIVRLVVESMPDESIDKLVSLLYMRNYTDMDVRDELEITKKLLIESRLRIRQRLLDAGVMDRNNYR